MQSALFRIKRLSVVLTRTSAKTLTSSHVLSGSIMKKQVKAIIPVLDYELHKGQMGRIGVVGGSPVYTGAPYFAGIAALRVGADLSYVFCCKEAAVVIKSYSPDLIVLPLLDHKDALGQISEWLPRLHSIVIGPGLGRDPAILENVKGIIMQSMERNIPVIIDADGLFLITEQPEIVQGYGKAILTPNIVEFERLYSKVIGHPLDKSISAEDNTKELSEAMGHVTIVQKGPQDIITNGYKTLICDNPKGCPRRCGGQGDILSGAMGTFQHWANMAMNKPVVNETGPALVGAYAACQLTRSLQVIRNISGEAPAPRLIGCIRNE
ncbi:unnamed protein product [Owenia fusiformis]|uniref:ATP-dependent (S)-NAD(P)H-hydrate dehydratase n=1 Tax=Owenia fusiformis TaxID=6347 RepID=A0A8S4N885_OWEFU|nr:unnamed protein product [Owenia fusiformis]